MRLLLTLFTVCAATTWSADIHAQNATDPSKVTYHKTVPSKPPKSNNGLAVSGGDSTFSQKALEQSFSDLKSTARLQPSLTSGSIEAILNTTTLTSRKNQDHKNETLKDQQRQTSEQSAAFFAHHSAALGINIEHPAAIKALELLGAPYRWGGIDEDDGVDCSGFIIVAFEEAGFNKLPRTAAQMAKSLKKIAIHQLTPGDLVFFNTRGPMFSHVGIYLGKNLFAHAPRSGARARIDDMTKPYWLERFNGARSAPITSQQSQAQIMHTQFSSK